MISGLTNACQTFDTGAWIVVVALAMNLLFTIYLLLQNIKSMNIIEEAYIWINSDLAIFAENVFMISRTTVKTSMLTHCYTSVPVDSKR